LSQLDLSGNIIAGSQTEVLKQMIKDMVSSFCSLIKKTHALKILNISGMGLKHNLLPIVDAISTNKTLCSVILSANQSTKLDEDYILKLL